MTGFGRGRVEYGSCEIVVEVKSVNHRFLDIVCKLPPVYSSFEIDLLKLVKSKLNRGRVEIFVSRVDKGESEIDIQFNKALFDVYLAQVREALKGLSSEANAILPLVVANLLGKREILEPISREVDSTPELAAVSAALEQAVTQLCEMRKLEGEALEKEVRTLLQDLERVVDKIGTRTGRTPAEFKQRLEQRLERLAPGLTVDQDRLALEVALLADRIDITEELARLRSHLTQFASIVSNGEGGRKLDFLIQEMSREINTAGSKAQDSEITALVIEGKATAEKLKEQVQNIE